MRHLLAFLFLSICLLWLPLPALADTRVVASIRPVALLVQELTAGLPISVETMLPEGATPHDYSLKPSDIKNIAAADLVVWLGENNEPYLTKVVARAKQNIAWSELPSLQRLPVRNKQMEGEHDLDHEHDHDHDHHEHDHHDTNYDMHFWFSVDNSIKLLNQLQTLLVQLDDRYQEGLDSNRLAMLQRLQSQLTASHQAMSGPREAFLLSHDAYQYLETDLGVQASGAMSLDPEIKPGVKHLLAIKEQITTKNIRCVIIDPSVSVALLHKVDRTPPLKQVAIDPIAWDFAGATYSGWLQSVYGKMVTCVQK